jgi:exopolysaccharide biosynthesis polyprenyl glycosylphosphotransferase
MSLARADMPAPDEGSRGTRRPPGRRRTFAGPRTAPQQEQRPVSALPEALLDQPDVEQPDVEQPTTAQPDLEAPGAEQPYVEEQQVASAPVASAPVAPPLAQAPAVEHDVDPEISGALAPQLDPAGLEVRPLESLRPVPPLQRLPARRVQPPPRTPMPPQRPVYDPFSARRRQSPEWVVRYTARLVVSDLVAVVVAGFLAVGLPIAPVPRLPGPWWLILVLVATGWVMLQASFGTYAERLHGTGPDEYRRVTVAGITGLALTGFVAPLVSGCLDLLVLFGLPVATVLTLAGRVLNRRRLHRARGRGQMTKSVVVVGREVAVHDLVRRVRRDPTAGLTVVGACVPRSADAGRLMADRVPVLGALDEVLRVVDEVRADTVLVASASDKGAHWLRDLAWRLEGTNIQLLVGPGVIEVAPNRLQVRPTLTVPLIQIREPEFRGSRRVVKTVLDRLAAAVGLLLAAPVFAVIAVLIKLTSPGPVLYRHRRVGKRGMPFDVFKFRSMVADAPPDVELMQLNQGNEVQFKMRQDPRVTRVGRVLRRYSLDELPQLLNVLRGEMSLVGPRPHVTREVEQYGPDMHRRLLVLPGITGLWQVSGRSDLSWEEAVELDVRYVENWSIGLDLAILWRTAQAVLRSAGAY